MEDFLKVCIYVEAVDVLLRISKVTYYHTRSEQTQLHMVMSTTNTKSAMKPDATVLRKDNIAQRLDKLETRTKAMYGTLLAAASDQIAVAG